MNLYKLHSSPETLDHHDGANEVVPALFWSKYENNPPELKKREQFIAKDAAHSYNYARNILGGQFNLGEPAIAVSALYSYLYAKYVIKGPFKLGKPAIDADSHYSFFYHNHVIKYYESENEKSV